MNKYIVVTTLCDKEEIVNRVIDELLKKMGRKLANGKINMYSDKRIDENIKSEILITFGKLSLIESIKKGHPTSGWLFDTLRLLLELRTPDRFPFHYPHAKEPDIP